MLKYRLVLLTFIFLLLVSCNESSQKIEDDIFMALEREDVTAITAFLEGGTPVDVTDDILHTPLMLAAAEPNMEMVELFLSKGADPLLTDRAGRNALTHAVRGGNLELVERMVKLGGDLKQLDRSKRTLLMHAAEKNRPELIKYLLKKGLKLEDKSFTGNSALMYAAESNHLESVKLLVQKGARINAKDNYGSTALSFAVDFGHYETAKYLLEKGANINVMSNYETTLLTSAVHYSDIKMVELLLDYGADINAKDMNKKTGQHYTGDKHNNEMRELFLRRGASTKTWIIRDGNSPSNIHSLVNINVPYQMIKEDMDKKFGDVNFQDKRLKRTALMLAIDETYPDRFKIMNSLIEYEADMNLQDRDGETALMMAVERHKLVSIAILVSSGADVSTENGYGRKAIDYIEPYHSKGVRTLLLEAEKRKVTLEEAARILNIELIVGAYTDNFDIVKKKTEDGADINESFGRVTPLMAAANNGNMEMVKYLLSKGADSSINGYEGKMAADYALISKHYEITHLLFKDSKALFLYNGSHTPLTFCAGGANIEGLKYFLSQGYDINKKAGKDVLDRTTPLMKIVSNSAHSGYYQRDYISTIKFLIENGADVNIKRKGGITPLMMAATNKPKEIIPILLDAGAEIDATDSKGMSALAHAALSGSYEAAKVLIERGADVHIMSDKKQSLIDIGYKYPDIVRLLLKSGHKPDQVRIRLLGGVDTTFLGSLRTFDKHMSKSDLLSLERVQTISTEFFDRPLPTFKLLLEHGAEPYAGYSSTFSNALSNAYSQRNRVAMRMMLELGYSVEEHIEEDLDPVYDSLMNKTFDITQLLTETGADLDRYDKSGYTPLYYAVHNIYPEQVELLLKAGADINKPRKDRDEPPIFRAIFKENLELVKLLVKYGAKLDVKDQDGETPLQLAKRYKADHIVEYLQQHTDN